MTSGLGRDEVRDDPQWVPDFLCDLGSNNIPVIGGLTSACCAPSFLLCHADFSVRAEGSSLESLCTAPHHWLSSNLGSTWFVKYIQSPPVSLWGSSQRLHPKWRVPGLKLVCMTDPVSALQLDYAWCWAPACVPADSSRLRSSGQGTAYVAVQRQDGVSLSIIYLKKFLEARSLNSAGELGLFRHTVIWFF